jgi:signal transduction histidine kinase
MVMNCDVEESPNATPAGTLRGGDLVARAAGRIEGWFRRADPDRSDWELKLRLEERRRERERIVRELRTGLFEGFLSVRVLVEDALRQLPEDSPNRPSLDHTLSLMGRVMEEGRGVLHELSSSGIGSMNLEQALLLVRDEFTLGAGAQCRIFVKGQPKAIKPVVQQEIQLMSREALVNALRHSQATRIEGEVEYLSRRLRVVIRDNGRGIDPEVLRSGRPDHWGLTGMRERAARIGAQLRIWSGPGAGTEVEILMPIDAEAHACA